MMNSRMGTLSDIKGVLALQQKNLMSELSKEDLKKGFVTTPFTPLQITEIINQDGLFIVEENTAIIAYAFAGTWQYFEQWSIFPYMVSRFPKLNFEQFEINTNTCFQYGPVCIEHAYRGKKVLNLVFEEMRVKWVKKYPLSLTFINQINEVSTKAHLKIGWKIIDEFSFNNNKYFALAYDMKKFAIV